jgi:hypothetical protein
MFTIIEDCSPYYIRFTHDNIEQIIDICQGEMQSLQSVSKFTHHILNRSVSEQILNLAPMTADLKLRLDRVSLFVTPPGYYYRAHKDGLENRMSINYTVQILDDKCVTSWYSDEELADYVTSGLDGKIASRECEGFVKQRHTPLKAMTAIPRECILFNTDIFHDFDNSLSSNTRAVLTLRSVTPGKIYFEDAKRILFDV